MMHAYRSSIRSTIALSPVLSSTLAADEMSKLANERGTEISGLCTDKVSVYRFEIDSIRAMIKAQRRAESLIEGAFHLPEIALIGLVSAYDAFLANLLRCAFNRHPGIVLRSDKDIKLGVLLEFEDLDQAKAHLIEEEIDSILRRSHTDQLNWIERKLKLTLLDRLPSLSSFVELCERRNLMTHTGGHVSKHYIKNCEDFNINTNATIGERLTVDPAYLRKATEIVTETGLMLGYLLWGKSEPDNLDKVDSSINDTAVNLIAEKQFTTAANILECALSRTKHSSEKSRRMIVVNLANAVKHQGDQQRSLKILDREDWTAVAPEFQVCVAAVRDDTHEVCRLMRTIGEDGTVTAADYRDWPVFSKIAQETEFTNTFKEVFGEPFVTETQFVSQSLNAQADKSYAEDLDKAGELPDGLH